MFNLPPPRHIPTLPDSGAKADIAGLLLRANLPLVRTRLDVFIRRPRLYDVTGRHPGCTYLRALRKS